jgi:lysyl-tRNA synthetase class 2
MGKARFIVIKDRSGTIQLFFQLDRLGEKGFAIASQLEPGDIVGAEGELKKTRTGEISIFVDEFQVLSKALLSPPEKYHGLRDQETRHRRRYVDLFTNDRVMETFRRRVEIVRYVRRFLQERGFLEVETPMMQPIPGGAAARPFITHHNTLDMDLYLRVAPELYLKRLLVGGMERVFEINRNFRNEGTDPRHSPEFTMLELYEAYGDYTTMMALTEALISGLAREVCGSQKLPYGQGELDFTPPWPRAEFWDLLEEHAGVGRGQEAAIRARVQELELDVPPDAHPDWLALQLLDKCAEDRLDGPVFIVDYPKSVCPLTRAKASDPELAERFELIVRGMEMANAYTELNDPQEQERRFMEQVGKEDERERIDRDFLRALAYGMPPAGGLGIGIDRLVMVLTNNVSIREVILFPLLRPEEAP